MVDHTLKLCDKCHQIFEDNFLVLKPLLEGNAKAWNALKKMAKAYNTMEAEARMEGHLYTMEDEPQKYDEDGMPTLNIQFPEGNRLQTQEEWLQNLAAK